MLERLREFIAKHRLAKPGETIAVGYSGGADSTCLLHLLKTAGYDVVAAHLHHGQRKEANEEQELCEEFATSLDISFLPGKADVPALAKDFKIGLEEAGRNARYEFFERVSLQLKGARIATAHTLDDHVETMLLHFVRGAGKAGFSGIPVERGVFIRPLIWARRAETRAYCEKNGFWFHEDPANDDPKFARVRMRKEVIPILETINSRALENAARLGEILDEEDSLLDGMAAAMLERCEIQNEHALAFLTKTSEVKFDADKLRHYPFALLRRGIRLAISALGGSADFEQAQAAAAKIVAGEKISVTVEGGQVVFEITPDVATARVLERIAAYRQPLTLPGQTISDEMGWQIAAFESQEPHPDETGSLRAVVDHRSAKGSLYVRPFAPGDKMQPIGLTKEKKLQDLLTDAHVTAAMKVRLPIVCDMLGPIWIPGVALAERVKLTGSTQRRLSLQFEPISTDETV